MLSCPWEGHAKRSKAVQTRPVSWITPSLKPGSTPAHEPIHSQARLSCMFYPLQRTKESSSTASLGGHFLGPQHPHNRQGHRLCAERAQLALSSRNWVSKTDPGTCLRKFPHVHLSFSSSDCSRQPPGSESWKACIFQFCLQAVHRLSLPKSAVVSLLLPKGV